jgi:hypothetical protein
MLTDDPADGYITERKREIHGECRAYTCEDGALDRGQPPHASQEDEESDESAELRKDGVHALVEVFPLKSRAGGKRKEHATENVGKMSGRVCENRCLPQKRRDERGI